ncbi:conserved Plasmodium protein, unknown function [Plasmodium gallinaceum]|uniref:Uncharacterized protein n=1 Tax=Plasmodium gallinaceum TaxID=5849 RepID=A0A1J1GN48_PLAGA|nr:conserved Plasmodium protein, unknown function [Plasmodium gallinaceum]CRG93889.1 conserved Plasmodium protein, unknown function [Plasmodium gallinaceum]
MAFFIVILILLFIYFIFDYHFCSKGLVFYLGNKSLKILKKCNNIEKVYRSTIYLMHPFLQHIFVHLYYLYLEKKKSYLNGLISEKLGNNTNNSNNNCIHHFLIRIIENIKNFIYIKLLNIFIFIVEYTNIYENINFNFHINTREVLNNNNFGTVIIDYYLPNATTKKKNVKDDKLNNSDKIDLYDLVNINRQKKINLILIDNKWKRILNIEKVDDANVQYLYLQDTVLIQYLQFSRILNNDLIKNINDRNEDKGIQYIKEKEKTYKGEEINSKQKNITLTNKEPKEEIQRNNVIKEQIDEKLKYIMINTRELENKINLKNNIIANEEIEENIIIEEKELNEKLKNKEKIQNNNNNNNINKNKENVIKDKLNMYLNHLKYKNIKGIIIIVPEIFYNYINIKDMKNKIPLYYFLTKDIKIDSFTIIAKLLGYICVHIHINVNFGLSIPFIFKTKNTNIFNLSNNFNFHKNKNSINIYNKDRDTNIEKEEDSSYINSLKNSFIFNNETNEHEQIRSSSSYISYDEKEKINSNNKSYNNNGINNFENNSNNIYKNYDFKVNYNNENFSSEEINTPLFSSPFSFFSDNYNDLNIAMNHFKIIFKNYNFIFLSFNDGTNILLNYFLEKIYKKRKKKGMDEHMNSQFNLNNANVYKYHLQKYKGNEDIKKDSCDNVNEKKNNSRTFQSNRNEEEKEFINIQNKNNIMNLFFKDKKKLKENKEKKLIGLKRSNVEIISDDSKKKEKKTLYNIYDKEEEKEDKIDEKNLEDSNGSFDEVEVFNEVVNEQIKQKVIPDEEEEEEEEEDDIDEEKDEEEEKVEEKEDYVVYDNYYEEDENDNGENEGGDEEYLEEEKIKDINENLKKEKSKKKNNKKNIENHKIEKTKNNKKKWKSEKIESLLSLSKLNNIFNKSTDIILEKNNEEYKSKDEKNESKLSNSSNTKITKKNMDSNTNKVHSNNKYTNLNLTNFTSFIKKNSNIHQNFSAENIKKNIEHQVKSNDNFLENLKKKKIKLNVLKTLGNKDSKMKDDALKDASGFSQKFRYSFFKIKNKFKQNFNNSENKIAQDKKIVERDKMNINSFNKNKNRKDSEENSSTLVDYNYDDYRKKHTKELCILINFSYNNMFDIFNYPDDFTEKKKKKFSLIHKIFYSLNVFFNSFSTLIKQRYFFSCTEELTKFLKMSLFFNYDGKSIYNINSQNNMENNILFGINKNCSSCGMKLKYLNDCYCILRNENDLVNNVSNNGINCTNNSNNINLGSDSYNLHKCYKDTGNCNKSSFNSIPNHSNNNKDPNKTYNKCSDNLNYNVINCNNIISTKNDCAIICHNCNKNISCRYNITNENDEYCTNNNIYKNEYIFYDNYCLNDISDKLNNLRNRRKNDKSYDLSKKINTIIKNSENYYNFINENNSSINNEYLIKSKKKEKKKNFCDKNNEASVNIPCSKSNTLEDNLDNNNLIYNDINNLNDINIRNLKNIKYEDNSENKINIHFNIEKLHEKWKVYFENNKLCLSNQDYFLFNLSFIYNIYNYLILIYICTYFREDSYFNFCDNQKFYQFIKKVHSFNKKKECCWSIRHLCDTSVIPNFFDFKDYKLLKAFFFLLQNSSNMFISKNIEYFNFPVVLIFCSDSKNFNFNHLDIIKISKNNNIIYLLYKRGNEGLFLSGLKPFIWIHKVLFDFVESIFSSSYDN